MHHPTDRIAHTTAFVTPVMENWLEREIGQWVHHEGRSDDPLHHELTLLPRSYISLLLRQSCYRIQYNKILFKIGILLKQKSWKCTVNVYFLHLIQQIVISFLPSFATYVVFKQHSLSLLPQLDEVRLPWPVPGQRERPGHIGRVMANVRQLHRLRRTGQLF